MSTDALVLSPLTFLLVGFFAVAMGLLASYIKDKVGERKKGLLELWAELSYFVAVYDRVASDMASDQVAAMGVSKAIQS